MSKIKINSRQTIEGTFSFNVSVDKSTKMPILVVKGILETADEFSDIAILENERYLLTGIVIESESYGSEDDLIAHDFLAKEDAKKRR